MQAGFLPFLACALSGGAALSIYLIKQWGYYATGGDGEASWEDMETGGVAETTWQDLES